MRNEMHATSDSRRFVEDITKTTGVTFKRADETDVTPVARGITSPSQRSIKSHLTDYDAKLKTASPGDHHVRTTLNDVRAIADFAGFTIASDITADGVNHYAQELRDFGRSARTFEACLTAIKGFSKWLTQNHKLPRDPLASVKKPNPKTDRRRERRMLLPDEWRWLEATTSSSGTKYGMTVYERVLLYRTGIEAVQVVMRHSTITLTMDTYGHLFPGQEADAVASLDRFFSQYTRRPISRGDRWMRAARGAAVGTRYGSTRCDTVRRPEPPAGKLSRLWRRPKHPATGDFKRRGTP